jgi:hypothetical protein
MKPFMWSGRRRCRKCIPLSLQPSQFRQGINSQRMRRAQRKHFLESLARRRKFANHSRHVSLDQDNLQRP